MKIGIIGLGFVGQIHSKVMESLKSDIEYYVYDITPNIAKEFEKNNNCKAVDTIEELFNNVDAVIVATPTFTHYSLVIEAIKKGKHVLCEKPMSLQIKEAIEMSDMSKEKNLICTIGFNYRFFEITEILKKNNDIGKINNIRIEIKRLFRNDWHTKENGVLADLGIHLIDYIYYICNEEIKLPTCKINQKYIDDWDYDTIVRGKLENEISFELCASRIKDDENVRFAFEITGESGKFLYDSRQENLYSIKKEKNLNTYQFEKREKTEGFFDFTDSILRQDIEWIKAISNGDKCNIATFEDRSSCTESTGLFHLKKIRRLKSYIMKKIFIACPISKYISNDKFINDELKMFIESLYDICQKYADKVFLALRREEYGKKLMKDKCTKLDFEEMQAANMVVAIPEDSKGTGVELGWASCMNKKIILILNCNQRYTPLISGLNDITNTEVVWYNDVLDKNILNEVEKIIQKEEKK